MRAPRRGLRGVRARGQVTRRATTRSAQRNAGVARRLRALPRAQASARRACSGRAGPPALRDREPDALASARERHARERVAFEKFVQYAVRRAVARAPRVRRASAASGSSATCRSSSRTTAPTSGQHRELFFLDDAGEPTRRRRRARPTTSAPPGQRWGNPLYRWRAHARGPATRGGSQRLRSAAVALRRRAPRSLHRLPALLGDPGERADRRRGALDEGAGRATSSTPCGAALGDLPLIAEDLGAVDAGGLRPARSLRAAGDQDPPVRLRRRPVGARRSCRTTTRDAPSSTPARTTTTRPSAGFTTRAAAGSTRTPEQAQREREAALALPRDDGRRGDPLGHDPRWRWPPWRDSRSSRCRTCWASARRRG